MATLAALIATRQSILEYGRAASPLNMESSAANSVEGCDAEVSEGANPDWGVVDMCGARGDGYAEGEGDDYSTVGRWSREFGTKLGKGINA
jgi:hypothetical protein